MKLIYYTERIIAAAACVILLFAANAHAEAVYNDLFSDFRPGSVSGQENYTVSGINNGSLADITDMDGERVLRLYRSDTETGEPKLEKRFGEQLTDDIVIKMSAYLSSQTEKVLIYLQSSSGTIIANLRINDDGTLRYINGDGTNKNFSPAVQYKSGEWNDFEIYLIKENGSEYYNRVRVCLNSEVCFTSDTGTRNGSARDFGRIRIQLPSNGQRATDIRLRNISVYRGSEPSIVNLSLEPVTGTPDTVRAKYDFISDYGGTDCSTFEWQVSGEKDGEYVTEEKQYGNEFILDDKLSGSFVRCVASPTDAGGMRGGTVVSEPIYVDFIDKQIFDFDDGALDGFDITKTNELDSIGIENGKLKMSRVSDDEVTVKRSVEAIYDCCECLFSLMIPEDSNPRFNLYAYGESGYDIPIHIQFYDGIISWHNGEKLAGIGSYEPGTEYEVRVVTDFNDDKADVYVNGILLGAGLDMRSPASELRSVKMQLQGKGAAYVDYLKVQSAVGKKHPKVLTDRKKSERLKTLIKTNSEYFDMWSYHCDIADRIKSPPSSYPYPKGTDTRRHGENLANLAFSYMITGDNRYYERAVEWGERIAMYPDSDYRDSLNGAHHLVGLSLFYDWCYDKLVKDGKDELILNAIVKGGNTMNKWLNSNSAGELYLSNQLHIRLAALGISAVTVSHDYNSNDWLKTAKTKWNRVFELLADDGASIEGAGYGEYSLQYMLMYLEAAKDIMGIDYTKHPWITESAYYHTYLTMPYNSWGSAYRNASDLSTYHTKIDIGDSPRYAWYGPDYLLRWLAANNGNGIAQTLADRYAETGYRMGITPFCNLLWYDGSVEREPLDTLPQIGVFDNIGMVVSRTGWDGDENVLVFNCGKALGEKAVPLIDADAGSGHAHPFANSFCLFANGEMLIPNAGYVQRRTMYENTLLVNGYGQLDQSPDATYWDSSSQLLQKDKRGPKLITVESDDRCDYIVGDATDNYPSLNKYKRFILFFKPNVLLICDDISAERENRYELLFHMEDTGEHMEITPEGYRYNGGNTTMEIKSLTGADSESEVQDILARGSDETDCSRYLIKYIGEQSDWRHITAITFGAAGDKLPVVTMDGSVDAPVINIDGKPYYFDWGDMPETYVGSDGSYSFANHGETGGFYAIQAKYTDGLPTYTEVNQITLESDGKYEGSFKEAPDANTVTYIWTDRLEPVFIKRFNQETISNWKGDGNR